MARQNHQAHVYLDCSFTAKRGTEHKRNTRTCVQDGEDNFAVCILRPAMFLNEEKLHEQRLVGANGITKIEDYHPYITAL